MKHRWISNRLIYKDDFVQDNSNSNALATELLQSWPTPWKYLSSQSGGCSFVEQTIIWVYISSPIYELYVSYISSLTSFCPFTYGDCYIIGYCGETHPKLKSCEISFAYSLFPSFPIVFHFAHCTAMIVTCFAQRCETIGQLKYILWINDILRDLMLRSVIEGYIILYQTPWFIEEVSSI